MIWRPPSTAGAECPGRGAGRGGHLAGGAAAGEHAGGGGELGLERIIALLARRPVATRRRGMRKALAALMRIGGDSFTWRPSTPPSPGAASMPMWRRRRSGERWRSLPDIPGIPKDLRRSGRSLRISCQPTWDRICLLVYYMGGTERKISCWAGDRRADWGAAGDAGG